MARMAATLGVLAALGCASASASSPPSPTKASFDCAKAATKVEKTICADAALAKLDVELATEYKAALLRTGAPKELRAAQAAWLKSTRDKCASRACLHDAYAARIAELQRNVAVFADLTGGIIGSCASMAAVAGSDATHCRVTESGSYGRVGDREQSYAIYCLDTPREDNTFCETAGIALFDVDPRTEKATRWLHRVDTEGDGQHFGKPELLQARGGLLLDLPVSIPGTGAFNASALYQRRGERWAPIDTTSWEKDLAARLPKGLAVWKGIWPDYRKMRAETGLYRSKDANCCPTGGMANIGLRLDGDRIALATLKIGPPPR